MQVIKSNAKMKGSKILQVHSVFCYFSICFLFINLSYLFTMFCNCFLYIKDIVHKMVIQKLIFFCLTQIEGKLSPNLESSVDLRSFLGLHQGFRGILHSKFWKVLDILETHGNFWK